MMFVLFKPLVRSGELIGFEPTIGIEASTAEEALMIAKGAGHKIPIVGPLPEWFVRSLERTQ